jgi:hypothetical protein
MSHKGLGDTIAALAESLKLNKAAQKIAQVAGKEDCGCKKRQQKLNELIPYNKKGSI